LYEKSKKFSKILYRNFEKLYEEILEKFSLEKNIILKMQIFFSISEVIPINSYKKSENFSTTSYKIYKSFENL